MMREFVSAFSKLPPTQREACCGVSMGTVKSRIIRGRDRLERLLLEGNAERPMADRGDATADRDPDEADNRRAPRRITVTAIG